MEDMLDLAVIGAGIYGIQAARTYLELHPYDKVAIFEASNDVGGAWSTERVYDGFWTQTTLGILEFSDMPLKGVPATDKYHDFFPAHYVAKYLNDYVNQKEYAGVSLAARINLRSKVELLEKIEDSWRLHIGLANGNSKEDDTKLARKVIDATGLTSNPNIPSLAGCDDFRGLILHSKNFAKHQQQLSSSADLQKVAVIGGAKSAADIAYALAKTGLQVTWIIRKSGSGPAAFVSAKGSGLYENSNESFYTRFTSHFLASYFLDESKTWLGRFVYGTNLGRRLLQRVWRTINTKAHAYANYDRADPKGNGFSNLKPDMELFWQNDSTGICQHPDFFDTILENVKVCREDVECLNTDGLELGDGSIVQADVIVLATGWKLSHPEMKIAGNEMEDLSLSLGLPRPRYQQSLKSGELWTSLEQTATKDMLNRFTLLHDRPMVRVGQDLDAITPLRLYKGVLPISDRSIAFVGQMLLGNNFRAAEVQALYAVAALDGDLELPDKETMQKNVAQTIAWDRLRYLAKGQYGNWIYWDLVPYTDNLLNELGLHSHRHQSWWKDLLSPCFARDLRNVLAEYKVEVKDKRHWKKIWNLE